MAQFCKLWFVACPEKLIDKDEVPPGWGLIHVKEDGGLKYVKPAPEHPHREPSWVLFASLMRDVTETWVPSTTVDQLVLEQVKERMARMSQQEGYELKEAKRQLDAMRAKIEAFESSSGVKLDRYSDHFNREIGSAVAALRRWNSVPHDELRQVAERVNRLSQEINEVAHFVKEYSEGSISPR